MDGLLRYRSNTHSQNGEDGVIAEVLRRLGISTATDLWCVEFGAWDGVHLSNTFRLVEEEGWNAVYIEGDETKFRDLQSLASRFSSVRPIKAMVVADRESDRSLDALLSHTAIPKEYSVLSVDVDSDDLGIWEAHVLYRPLVVCIEINSRIAPGRRQMHGGLAQGNSFTSMVELGVEKGYTPVCHTGNLIFVDNDVVGRIGLPEAALTNPNRLFLPFALPRWHPTRVAQTIRRFVGDSTI